MLSRRKVLRASRGVRLSSRESFSIRELASIQYPWRKWTSGKGDERMGVEG